MPINDLIIALSNSNLDFPSNIIPMLWQAHSHIPEQVIDSLLTALEDSQEDHPEILNILLAECAPGLHSQDYRTSTLGKRLISVAPYYFF